MTQLLLRRLIVLVLVLAPVALFAADSKKVAEAPVPAPIVNAKKIFVANGGDDFNFSALGPNRSYNQFYAAMKDWGRFELVSSPVDADLVCEVSLLGQYEMYGSTPEFVPILKLKIIDPKTHTMLWQSTEPIEKNGLVGMHREAKFMKAMERLLKDLQELVPTSAK